MKSPNMVELSQNHLPMVTTPIPMKPSYHLTEIQNKLEVGQEQIETTEVTHPSVFDNKNTNQVTEHNVHYTPSILCESFSL